MGNNILSERGAIVECKFSTQDKRQIEEGIRAKYTKVATSPEGLFKYPTGRAGLEALKYDSEIIQNLPEGVASSYCGVGNPLNLGPIHEGERVLDVGCGAGVDTIVVAMLVGQTGTATGTDIIPEMLARAKNNLQVTGLKNVTFVEASAEKLPFPDGEFDVAISNGVLNLVVDKAEALKQIFRVLKPSGRLMMADQILVGELPNETEAKVKSWAK
jgi:arsenite methyltransferase